MGRFAKAGPVGGTVGVLTGPPVERAAGSYPRTQQRGFCRIERDRHHSLGARPGSETSAAQAVPSVRVRSITQG
jgi:hypothetical protein